MDGKPTLPPSEGSGAEPVADEDGERAGDRERYGPVVIQRHVKDDGRALLLYTHAAQESA
jgi:hypothetical protein